MTPRDSQQNGSGTVTIGVAAGPWVVAVGTLLILIAIAVRLWGLGWGLPYVYHADEPVNLSTTLTMVQERDPNPHFFNYPPFFYYVEAGGQLAYFAVGAATGEFESVRDISKPEMQTLANGRLGNQNSMLAGRLISVAFSVATVAVVFAAVLGVSGSLGGAALAGLLMAFGPLMVRRGRLMTPDPIATFFVAATLAASCLLLRRGSRIDYALAGVLVGLAGSSKYHVALVGVVVLAAHVMRTGRRSFRDGKIYIAGAAAILTFAVTSPFVLLDFQGFWAEFAWKTDFYSGSRVGGDAASLAFYIRTLFSEYGLLLLLTPFAFVSRRVRREAILSAGFSIVYVVFVTFFVVRFDRHLLPALPAVAMTIGFGAAGLILVLKRRTRRWRATGSWMPAAVLGLIVMIGVVFPFTRTIDDGARSSSDERAEARNWIQDSLPPGSTVLVDAYAPLVDPDLFVVTGSPFVTNVAGDVSQYEYVVVAEKGTGRFLANPETFPGQVNRFSEQFGSFCEIAEFPGPPWIRVLSRDCLTPSPGG